jgi:cellobiose phosphorylase
MFVLGYSEDKKASQKIVSKFSTREAVEKEFERLKKYWADNLSKLSVKTPDEDINLMVNVWNQYQVRTTFNWSRSASYYESGIGRGMGFRDSNQDTMGFVYQIPDKVKQRIIDLASTQFAQGDAYHQYSPLTKKGNGRGYSDDHLWLVYSVAAYIKETGDVKFLSQKIPYDTGKKATMYDHLARAIKFSVKNSGPHKLPLAGFADWNDCLNMKGPKNHAESVMVAQMLAGACLEMSTLAGLIKKRSDARKYETLFKKVSKQINKVAWDGEWYLRAFDDNKKPIGSKKNKEGKIFLETQGWAVLTGVADKDRALACLDSVKKHLATKYGIMILQPSFAAFHPELGSISMYPPGLKENGAIFCHPNPWIIISECIVGRGEQAFEYYKAIAPSEKNKISDIHKLEPYVYCQMIAGQDHKDFGEAKNAWLTGSAAWNFIAISQWILGIRPDYKGLMIDPCIPSSWDGYEAKRTFRGCDYFITVKNPNHVCKGIVSMKVDGKEIKGNIIPVFRSKGSHKVEVVMG